MLAVSEAVQSPNQRVNQFLSWLSYKRQPDIEVLVLVIDMCHVCSVLCVCFKAENKVAPRNLFWQGIYFFSVSTFKDFTPKIISSFIKISNLFPKQVFE